jgi:hypothetical protein
MKSVTDLQPQAPPGLITTLSAGFEATTGHLWLILLPVLLDLVFWLGPRLGIAQLTDRVLSPLLEQPGIRDAVPALMDMTSGINVLTSLSVPLVGIPALMAGVAPEQTPVPTEVHEVGSMLNLLLIQVGLWLIGLLLAALYLSLISLALRKQQAGPADLASFAAGVIRSSFRLFGLAFVFLFALMAIWLPLMPVAFLLTFIAGGLAMYVLIGGFFVVVIYLSMSVPGIVLNQRPLLLSVRESLRLVRGNAVQTMSLLMIVLLVSSGTNLLWHLADNGTWLTVVSIAGHAFISTGLAAAIFIFYRDRWTYAQAHANRVQP